MGEISVSDVQVSAVEELVSFIRSRNRPSAAEIELLRKQRLPNYLSDSKEQIATKLGQLQSYENPLWFLAGETGEVREFLRTRDNDLDFQVDTVRRCFVTYFRDGEIPPPYYPYRISVILRKGGLSTLEQSFLEAWVSHFPGDGGGSYATLQERLAKILESRKQPSGSSK